MFFFHVQIEHNDIVFCSIGGKRKAVRFNENGHDARAFFESIEKLEGVYRELPIVPPTIKIRAVRGILGSTIVPTEGTDWPDEEP